MLVFFVLLLLGISHQQQLQDGQIISGTISPGQNLSFWFNVQNYDIQHILELAGNPLFSNSISLRLDSPLEIYLRPLAESTSIISIGNDLEDVHAYGIACQTYFEPGNYSLSLTTLSLTPQSYSILYTTQDNSLNNGRAISEEICCTGNGRTVTKNYFYDIPQDSQEVNIFVNRTSSVNSIDGLESMIYLRYVTCPEGLDIHSDYSMALESNGLTVVTINLESIPPLVPGQRLYISSVKSILTSNIREFHTLSACSGIGCVPGEEIIQNLSDSSALELPSFFLVLGLAISF